MNCALHFPCGTGEVQLKMTRASVVLWLECWSRNGVTRVQILAWLESLPGALGPAILSHPNLTRRYLKRETTGEGIV